MRYAGFSISRRSAPRTPLLPISWHGVLFLGYLGVTFLKLYVFRGIRSHIREVGRASDLAGLVREFRVGCSSLQASMGEAMSISGYNEYYWSQLPLWVQWLLILAGFVLLAVVVREIRRVSSPHRRRRRGRHGAQTQGSIAVNRRIGSARGRPA